MDDYKTAIELIDEAMMLSFTMPTARDEGKNETIKTQMKDLKKMIHSFQMQRSEILLRVGTIYKKLENLAEAESSHQSRKNSDTATTEELHRRPRTYAELEHALKKIGRLDYDKRCKQQMEILLCCNGVKLYYIENNGEVVSSLENFILRIVRLGCDFELNLDETIFLQLICQTSENSSEIGKEAVEVDEAISLEHHLPSSEEQTIDQSFIYPLIPGVTPCLRTKFGALILPDLHSNDGSAIGLFIPPEFDELFLDFLITILKGNVLEDGTIEFGDFTTLGDDATRFRRSTGDKVSENIVTSAQWISLGLKRTAEKTGEFIDYSTPFILRKIHKGSENPAPVSQGVQNSVAAVKSVSGYAAQGTSFLASKVGDAMSSFGSFLAPHVHNQGSRLLTYTTGMEEGKARDTMTETLKIASGAADGISTIYGGLESSAGILGKSIASSTVKVVEHKYGEPSAELATQTFDTVGNLYNLKRNFNIITPKGLVKSTAKGAGFGVLRSDQFRPKVYLNKNYFTGNVSLYPDLEKFAKEFEKKQQE